MTLPRTLPLFLTAALGLAAASSSASAAVLLFDFGAAGTQTAGNVNNVVEVQAAIASAIDTAGAATGITVTTTGFNASNTAGASSTTNPVGPTGAAAAIFGESFSRDSLFGNVALFNGVSRPSATVVFSGLDASGATTYSFDLFASRLGGTLIRETSYQLTGATVTSLTLDAANNLSQVVTAAGMVPSAAGEISILLTPGAANTTTEKFYYLGALRLTSTAVPEPSAAGLALLGAAVTLRRRRK